MTNLATVQQNETVVRADFSTKFTPEQRKVILDTCCNGASEHDAAALIAIAEARGMNPILGECYFVQRYDSQTRQMKWAVQASIDSFRIKAEQTGLYAGQDEPEFEFNETGLLVLARVRVYRKDWTRPAVGVARFDEYVQKTKEGQPTRFWKTMPTNQLAKCAEALALRKAFPLALAKVYEAAEMAQAENDVPQATVVHAKPLAPPPVAADESAGLADQIAGLMRASTNDADLAAAIQEASKAKSRLTKEDQKHLAKVMREVQGALLKAASPQSGDADLGQESTAGAST